MAEPLTYEEYLMKVLGLNSLKELEDFLNQPSWGCLDMQTPESPLSQEDRYLEQQVSPQ